MDESQKHYAKFKKVDTKGYILDDPIYMTFRKRQNCKDRNQVSGCERLGLGERGLTTKREEKISFGIMELFYHLTVVAVT